MAKVFLSFAGPDRDKALRIDYAIRHRGIDCFFSDHSISPGAEWPKELLAALKQCKVFVVVWSKDAAEPTSNVGLEIHHAADVKRQPPIPVIAVIVDGMSRDNFFLKKFSSLRWDTNAPSAIAQVVFEHLGAPDAPYPFGPLYRELNGTNATLLRHVEVVRVFVRFLSLIQIAEYISGRERSDNINKKIDAFLPLDSLFADLDAAREINRFVNARRDPEQPAFHFLTRLIQSPLPSAAAFDLQELAAESFDLAHIHQLCGIEDVLAKGSPLLTPEAHEILCKGILTLLRREFVQDSLREIRLEVRTRNGQMRMVYREPVALSAVEAAEAGIFLDAQWGNFELSPLVILIPSDDPGLWEPAILRRQDDVAEYGSLSASDSSPVEKPALVMRWAQLEAVRSVPSQIFAGESHIIRITLTNRARGPVQVREIIESPPENVLVADSSGRVRLGENVRLDGSESRIFEYVVVGRGESGTERKFQGEVRYLAEGEECTLTVKGDTRSKIGILQPPSLMVSRTVRRAKDGATVMSVALDDEVIITTRLKSLGAAVHGVRFEEKIEGADITDGETLFPAMDIARIDREDPIEFSYRLRIKVTGTLVIRAEASTEQPLPLEGSEARFPIRDMPLPLLQLRWTGAVATSAQSLEAEFVMQNAGGTSAYDVSVRSDSSGAATALVASHPRRLEAGASTVVRTGIQWFGKPTADVNLRVSFKSVQGTEQRAVLSMNLYRVVETDFSRLPVAGRQKARDEIRAALSDHGVLMFAVHGDRQVGKRRLIRAEIDALRQKDGVKVEYHEFDCENAEMFADALAKLVYKVVYADAGGERGSTALLSFLQGIGMNPADYKSDSEHLDALIHESLTPTRVWWTLGLLFSKIAKARGLDRIILCLTNVAPSARAEMDPLARIAGYFSEYPCPEVRMILTSQEPLRHTAVNREILVGGLTEEECNGLIDAVFVMPRVSPDLRKLLIDRSERIPGQLVSLMRSLAEHGGDKLNFSGEAGLTLLDRRSFDDLPTSLEEFETKAVLSSPIPPAVLACLAAYQEPVDIETLEALLERMKNKAAIAEALAYCVRKQWLVDLGEKGFAVTSPTLRRAFLRAATPMLLEQANQAICTLLENRNRPQEETFLYLAYCPAAFIMSRGLQLADGIRRLLSNGNFSQLRSILTSLRTRGFVPTEDVAVEMEAVETELRLQESNQLSPEELAALSRRADSLTDRNRRATLRMRLSVLESYWLIKEGRYAEAKSVAEVEKSSGFFRRSVAITDSRLEFDYLLNLWMIYYRLGDEDGFSEIDRWIWKRLETKHDAYEIARFLTLFYELEGELPTDADREARFPPPYAITFGEKRPIRQNKIEIATKTGRLEGSPLKSFLQNPDALNRENTLIIGRLFLRYGIKLWNESPTKRLLLGLPPDGLGKVEDFETFLMGAERFFREAGFPLDLGTARLAIGRTYVDRVLLAEKAQSLEKFDDWCVEAERLLRIAAENLDAIDATRVATEAWEQHADLVRRWSVRKPSLRPEAIRIYGWLLKRKEILDDPAKRDAHRLTLVLLLDEAGLLKEASALFNDMDCQTADARRLRAMIRAEALLSSTDPVTEADAANYRNDLKVLSSNPPLSRAVKNPSIQLASSFEAIGVLAWRLTLFHLGRFEATPALGTLRAFPLEIIRTALLSQEVRSDLPLCIGTLWHMEGTSPVQMVRDFSNILMLLVEDGCREAVEGALREILQNSRPGRAIRSAEATEKSNAEKPNEEKQEPEAQDRDRIVKTSPEDARAVSEMLLLLCEWSLSKGGDVAIERSLAYSVFQSLRALQEWTAKDQARLVARSIAICLRCGASGRDDTILREDLENLLESLRSARHYNAALRVVVYLVEMLLALEADPATRNTWYSKLSKSLSIHLRPLQELSESGFDEATHLINLYLQLPNRLTDAVDLMQEQCRELLAQRDYDTLSRYLSFLSDLLGRVFVEEAGLAHLLRRVQELDLDRDLDDIPVVATDKAAAIRAVAKDLCGRIIAEVREKQLGRGVVGHLLYNAGKLLEGKETSALRAAIYVKLFDLSDQVDGSCVWGLYSAWDDAFDTEQMTLEDRIAVITYSNCRDESEAGEFRGSPRNYLISSRARNGFLHKLAEKYSGAGEKTVTDDTFTEETAAETTSDESLAEELIIAHAQFEIQRLSALIHFAATIDEFMTGLTELQRLEWVTFLDRYVNPLAQAAPEYQMRQRIDEGAKKLEQERHQYLNELLRRRVIFRSDVARGMEQLSYRVQKFLIEYRGRGRAIVTLLVCRMSPFTLPVILGEVQRHLEGKERVIDFRSALGLWSGGEVDDKSSTDTLAFLERNPHLAIRPLINNAAYLLSRNQPRAAEQMLRCAQQICEPLMDGEKDLPEIFRGLTRSLRAQDKLEEACEMAQREVSGRQESDPEFRAALEELAETLQAAGRTEEALSFWRRKVVLDEALLAPEELSRETLRFIQFLRDVGFVAEVEQREIEIEAMLARTVEVRERTLGGDAAETLRAVRALADFFDNTGRKEKARPLHMRLITAVSSNPDTEPITLRLTAHECVVLGEYGLAESLLRRVLGVGFEIASNHVHLARVMILTGRNSEARDAIEQAWGYRQTAENYVVPRILWFNVLFAMEDDSDPSLFLRRLHRALDKSGAHGTWTIGPVLDVLELRLEPEKFGFLKALALACGDAEHLGALDNFPQWQLVATDQQEEDLL